MLVKVFLVVETEQICAKINISDLRSTLYQYLLLQLESSTEMELEPVPLQLEHVATNRSRNHHSTHLGFI